MTEDSVKATRADVQIGSFVVEGYMLPDGSYRMSLSQAAECVGLTARNAFDFLRSKTFKTLMGEGYTVPISEIESADQLRGESRIRALPLDVVAKYWHWQSHRGNKQAFALVDAFIVESLERRFDDAFSVKRSEASRNEQLAQRIQVLEGTLQTLGEAFAIDDDLRRENQYLRTVLQDNGIDPYALPPTEET